MHPAIGKASAPAGARTKEVCLELAGTAEVTSTFVVWSDSGQPMQQRHATPSFTEAIEYLNRGEFGSMKIEFRWRLGHENGRGAVEYFRVSHPLATMPFIRQTARNLVWKEIAAALSERHAG